MTRSRTAVWFARPARGTLRDLGRICAVAAGCFAASVAHPAAADTVATSTLINFNTNMGSFQVDLYDQLVGSTVNNFLSYTNSGAYNNTVIHRLQDDTTQGIGIVQGGGYTPGATLNVFSHIATSAMIPLQYRMDNSFRTISMARTSDPNSATSEWFFNTVDNTTDLGPRQTGNPNTDSDGYAVFGHVMAGSMAVVNSMYVLPNVGSSISDDFPLRNWTPGTQATMDNYVVVSSVIVAGTHPAFQNPNLIYDVDNNGAVEDLDALKVINSLIKLGIHSAATFNDTRYLYLDINGDGLISPVDAAKVIRQRILGASASAMASPLTAGLGFGASPLLVPEPSSCVLAAIAALIAAGHALARRTRPA